MRHGRRAPEVHDDRVAYASGFTGLGVGASRFAGNVMLDLLDGDPTARTAASSLRLVFCSGEALAPLQVARFRRLFGDAVRLVNLYGPTEAAVDVTAYEVQRGDVAIPIGRPVTNTTTVILDRLMQMVPPGVPGDLYLGGIQLARGYAGRTDLTADRFVADPFGAPGSRLYRTGDLARWNTSGNIEYLGRSDFQVKLRGQRLELGEVEAVLASVPGVVTAAAAVAKVAGGDHLVAYLSPADIDLDVAKDTVAQIGRAHV